MDTLLRHRIVEILNSGWRQKDLADATEKSQVAVSKWSAGEILTISVADANALAQLTGFSASWIVDGKGEKYGAEGLKIGPAKVRRSKNYKKVEDSRALASMSVLPGLRWDELIQQLGANDQNLAILLSSFQMSNLETRAAIASMANVIAQARPLHAQKILRAMWQASHESTQDVFTHIDRH